LEFADNNNLVLGDHEILHIFMEGGGDGAMVKTEVNDVPQLGCPPLVVVEQWGA